MMEEEDFLDDPERDFNRLQSTTFQSKRLTKRQKAMIKKTNVDDPELYGSSEINMDLGENLDPESASQSVQPLVLPL